MNYHLPYLALRNSISIFTNSRAYYSNNIPFALWNYSSNASMKLLSPETLIERPKNPSSKNPPNSSTFECACRQIVYAITTSLTISLRTTTPLWSTTAQLMPSQWLTAHVGRSDAMSAEKTEQLDRGTDVHGGLNF